VAKHAKLSASGSSRWIHCPGSIAAEAAVPINEQGPKSNPAAREGTAAHKLGETCLREKVHADEFLDWLIAVPIDEDLDESPEEFMAPAGTDILNAELYDIYTVDHGMCEAVQVYLDEVRGWMDGMDDPKLLVEQNYDLSWIHPACGGTADAVVSEEFETLVVTDYKHGRGVPVYIRDENGDLNTQALQYAAGAAHDAGWTHEKVILVIVQPRCPGNEDIQRDEISVADLRKWAEGECSIAAHLTEDPDAFRQAGSWCKWCKAASRCDEVRNQVVKAAGADFDGVVDTLPVPSTTEELSKAMAWIPMIDSWCKTVAGEVERRLLAGEEVTNYKLVQKRSNRKFDPGLSEKELIAGLIKAGRGEAKKADMVIMKPKTLTQLEKLGPKMKAALVAGKGLTVKPEGGLTVAHVSDKRAEATPLLTNEFEGTEDDE